ncbi:MAG: hypothetical protein FWD69_19430 [Polyangiaceae bacterium]|nr:hypothetical protein [Polyangiaceae bacterium]
MTERPRVMMWMFDTGVIAGGAGLTSFVPLIEGKPTAVETMSNGLNNNKYYEANLVEWQSDYENDVKALTGQAIDVPLFETHMSSWPVMGSATRSFQ